MASFLGTTNLSSGAAAQRRLSETTSWGGAPSAALCLKAVGAIDWLIAPRLEGHSRLAVTAGADGHEQLTPGCSAIAATAGIAGWPERIRALGLARKVFARHCVAAVEDTLFEAVNSFAALHLARRAHGRRQHDH